MQSVLSRSHSQPAVTPSAMRPLYAAVRVQLPSSLDQGQGLDRELRADDAQSPLRAHVPKIWVMTDISARLAHRAAAWDRVHAAFGADLRRALCSRDGALVDKAWTLGGLPARGLPLTARHVYTAHRLVELLGQMDTEACDGSADAQARGLRQLELAQAVYRQEALRGDPEDDWGVHTPVATLADEAWELMRDDRALGAAQALTQARLQRSQLADDGKEPPVTWRPASAQATAPVAFQGCAKASPEAE